MIGALTLGVGDLAENCTVLNAVAIHIQTGNTATIQDYLSETCPL